MNYLLAEACRNIFLLYDRLAAPNPIDEAFLRDVHRSLVHTGRDDALILTEGRMEGDIYYARMLVFGLDGTFGEFCGNGARCCAAYLSRLMPHIKKFSLITKYGAHPLEAYSKGWYSVRLPLPRLDLNPNFIAHLEAFREYADYTYVEMIEPHLVVEGNYSDDQLYAIGRRLNQQKMLFPQGINVNAWYFIGENMIHVKTYERGVQRLTKSCGTGSVSCVHTLNKNGTFLVKNPGGELEITVQKDWVLLKGPASDNRIVGKSD